jgi:hypothetical protein
LATRSSLIRACLFYCFIFSIIPGRAQNVPEESAAQRVTNSYVSLLSLSGTEKSAVKKAVKALESKGLYSKLLSLNIGKYFRDSKCYNLLIPSNHEGAFTLTIETGIPQVMDGGIRLGDGDQLNTHFINDLAEGAPNVGVFWYSGTAIKGHLIRSNSPFNITPRHSNGRAYVSIWASSSGVPVPQGQGGFGLAQRRNSDSVELYDGVNRYTEQLAINSPHPQGSEILIQGNQEEDFILKVFGITEALTEQQVADLKEIIDQLVNDLGI